MRIIDYGKQACEGVGHKDVEIPAMQVTGLVGYRLAGRLTFYPTTEGGEFQ